MSYNTSTSFWIAREKTFSVEVKGWSWSESEWAWNVYAHVFEDHPLFGDKETLTSNAPLHGGCTFDEERVVQPIGGPVYDFQKVAKTKTVGSDYKHLGSPNLSGFNPKDGIPWIVEDDAKRLVSWLKAKS